MSHRQQRLNDLLRQTLASLLIEESKDPRLERLTLTRVDVAADLGNARVYYRLLPDTNGVEVEKALQRAAGYFRRRLGEELTLRRVPNLQFVFDRHLETVGRLESLLHQISREQV